MDILNILADYYEERSFVNKARRLRNHKSLVIYGHHNQYNKLLGKSRYYGNLTRGNGWWFDYGPGLGYGIRHANGFAYFYGYRKC